MKKLYFTLLFLSSFNLSAQDSLYSKVFYDNVVSMETFASDNTIDSGLIIVGKYSNNEAFILRLDSLGNELWNKTIINVTGTSFYTDVVATSDSGFVSVGVLNNQALCVKYNALGDTLWSKSFGTASQYYSERTFITESIDSNYLITWGNSNDNSTYVIKLDANGNEVWSNTIDGISPIVPNVIIQASDSAIYIGGTIGWNTGSLMKLNNDGLLNWTKSFDPGVIEDILSVDDSLYVICAEYTMNNPMLIVMDTSAVISWANLYQGYLDGSNPNLHVRMFLASDSTLVFQCPSIMYSANVISRIELNGSYITNMVPAIVGSDILPSVNNGAFIIGNGPTYGIKSGIPHFGIIRTDSLLHEVDCVYIGWSNTSMLATVTNTDLSYVVNGPALSFNTNLTEGVMTYITNIACVDFLGGLNENNQALGVSVYPNSSNGMFTMEFEYSSRVEVNIFNTLGQLIFSEKTNSSNTLIDLSEFDSGIYHYKVLDKETGRSASGKMILSK